MATAPRAPNGDLEMASTWGTSWGTSWATSWDRGVTPPTPPQPSGGGGGGGRHHAYGPANWRRKKWSQTVSEWVDSTAAEMYADLVAPSMPKEVRKEAAALVKPYADTGGIPQPKAVDWEALSSDADRALEIIALWNEEMLNREILDDDDDILMNELL